MELIFIYQDAATVYGTIQQFDITNLSELTQIKQEFKLSSYPYNQTDQYMIRNPKITNANLINNNDDEYVLIAWIVIDVGVFANIFDSSGKRLICMDIEVYLSENTITNIDIASYFGFGIISFTTFDGNGDKIMTKIIDYSEYYPTDTINDCNTNKNDDGHVEEPVTTQSCDYIIFLSFSVISADGMFYLSHQINLIDTIKDSLNLDVNDDFYDIIIQSISSTQFNSTYQYSINILFCIDNDATYEIIEDSIENHKDKLITNLEALPYIQQS